MQFLRRRNPKNGDAALPSPGVNAFFGKVGSPIKMSKFDQPTDNKREHPRGRERDPQRHRRSFANDDTSPAPKQVKNLGQRPRPRRNSLAEATIQRPASPQRHRRLSLGGEIDPSKQPTPRNKGRGPHHRRSSQVKDESKKQPTEEEVETVDVKKKLILHKEIQKHQRQIAATKQQTPRQASKNDILSVPDSHSEEQVTEIEDTKEDVATQKMQPRDHKRPAADYIVPNVEPVQQLKLDGAKKAKIPHFMSAWFNAETTQAAEEKKEKEKPKEKEMETPTVVEKPITPRKSTNNSSRTGLSQTIQFSELTLGRMIGEGAFGKVYEGKWRGKGVAIKVLVCQDLRSDILHEFQSEVEIMSVLRHPNICRLLGACMDPPHRALVVELMQRGSLWGVLRTHRKTLDMEKRSRFIYDTAKGMAYLHHFERPILHRDLKSPNLLVDKNYNIKLSDFGLARVKAHVQTMTGNCGTVQWMAPEVLGNQKYTEKADVFSFGIVIWEVMTGECPYDGMSQIQAALGVLNRNLRPNMPRDCPPFFARLMKACWNRQPELRPSFPHIVSAFRTYQTSISENRVSANTAAQAAIAASFA